MLAIICGFLELETWFTSCKTILFQVLYFTHFLLLPNVNIFSINFVLLLICRFPLILRFLSIHLLIYRFYAFIQIIKTGLKRLLNLMIKYINLLFKKSVIYIYFL